MCIRDRLNSKAGDTLSYRMLSEDGEQKEVESMEIAKRTEELSLIHI